MGGKREPSALAGWLLEGLPIDTQAEPLLRELNGRLLEAGVPVWRCATSIHTRHPEVYVRMVVWERGEGCETTLRPHDIREAPTYRDSPVAQIHAGAPELRVRLEGDRAAIPFPILRELAEDGATDYLVLPVPLVGGRRTFVSWATDRPGGFAEADLAELRGLVPVLGLRLALQAESDAINSLLEVYLGQNAARRVLAGAFKRGTGEPIQAAIWFCDLRGFTELSDRAPVREVVALLDRYFETVAAPVVGAGGEILKFIGDAMLAIFPVPEGASPAEPCGKALDAAEAALAGLERLNAELAQAGGPTLRIGVALHHGEVLYGNIGAQSRLDFTVIGASVNEVCRVESLCKPLGVPLLVTSAFAGSCGSAGQRLVSMGAHALKGVSAPIEVYTLARYATGR